MEALYRLIMSKAPLFLPDATCIGSFSTYSFAGVALPEYELQYWLKRCKRNIRRLAVNCTDGLCSISSFFRCSLFCCIFEFLCRFSPCLIKVALLSLKMEAVIKLSVTRTYYICKLNLGSLVCGTVARC